MIQIHRLLQKIKGPFLHRRDRFFHRSKRRQQEHRDRGIGILRGTQYIESGRTRQLQVGNHQQVPPRANLLNRRRPVRCLLDGIAGALQRLAQHRAQFVLIFHKKKGFHVLCFYHESSDASREPTMRVR